VKTADCGLRTADCELRTADCRPGVKCRLRVKCRLQTKGKMQAGVTVISNNISSNEELDMCITKVTAVLYGLAMKVLMYFTFLPKCKQCWLKVMMYNMGTLPRDFTPFKIINR